MELLRRRSVMWDGVIRHVLGKVGLHHRDAHLEQTPVLRLEPLDRVRIRKIDGRARLGEALYEGGSAPILRHQEETLSFAFGAHLGIERHVRALPEAEAKS